MTSVGMGSAAARACTAVSASHAGMDSTPLPVPWRHIRLSVVQVGEGQKVYSDCSECFNLYSSPDFTNWKFEGCVLNNSNIVAPMPPDPHYRMERPKARAHAARSPLRLREMRCAHAAAPHTWPHALRSL